ASSYYYDPIHLDSSSMLYLRYSASSLLLQLRASIYLYNPMADMTLYYFTILRVDNPMTQPILRAPRPQFMESYHTFDQMLGFEPQNMLWGDSMPNRELDEHHK